MYLLYILEGLYSVFFGLIYPESGGDYIFILTNKNQDLAKKYSLPKTLKLIISTVSLSFLFSQKYINKNTKKKYLLLGIIYSFGMSSSEII